MDVVRNCNSSFGLSFYFSLLYSFWAFLLLIVWMISVSYYACCVPLYNEAVRKPNFPSFGPGLGVRWWAVYDESHRGAMASV